MLQNNDVKVLIFIAYQLCITSLLFLPLSTTEHVLNQIFVPDGENDILNSMVCRTELFVAMQIVTVAITLVASATINDSLIVIVKVLTLWCVAAILFHVISWCYGAPAFESFIYTLHLSSLMASLTVIPYSTIMDTDYMKVKQIFLLNRTDTKMETTVWFSVWGAILGAWLGAFPIPLDWDRPWQVWPVSCIIGAVSGYVFGLLVSTVLLFLKTTKTDSNKFKFS